MNKKALRDHYKKLRSILNDIEIDERSIAIANRLLQLSIWDFSYYHLFLPIEKQREVDTEFVLNILSGKDKNVIISKSDFKDHSMQHFLLTDNTKIKPNSYGIPEPVDGIEVPISKIDVVFVPLLAFDKKGNRVGYGKGFYDRFLNQCSEKTLKIGLSFFDAEEETIDVSEFDKPLDYCITPNKAYSFTTSD
ncbi:5-formyltetrahydrofolate cyclo-ligase [Spongiivirga citrea]|uniref:5-formyltetrahydrofolate cyclo-ligase n=1 Tax=Spongiivirga citrea TaxID=1481457 RepID=A0A6M0CMS5_9FLAO|nr:5-formyltetrahydrofolate cyclo-ligase [Spongiivirga citrea]NER17159.1 5-formyltetrahydrofolate cyclo-ligase [Spongiivirga citrea]